MAKEKTFGAITGSLNGFTVRMQVKSKKNHSGKFGIYAGKNLIQEVSSTKEAIEMISEPNFVDDWRRKKKSLIKK